MKVNQANKYQTTNSKNEKLAEQLSRLNRKDNQHLRSIQSPKCKSQRMKGSRAC